MEESDGHEFFLGIMLGLLTALFVVIIFNVLRISDTIIKNGKPFALSTGVYKCSKVMSLGNENESN